MKRCLCARPCFFADRRTPVPGEPIEYITGEAGVKRAEFQGQSRGRSRPETEHLVEKVLEIAGGLEKQNIAKQSIAKLRIADVVQGRVIAAGVGHKPPSAWVWARIHATEISSALAVAQENAERNGVADRVTFHEGDLLAPVAGKLFDSVVESALRA